MESALEDMIFLLKHVTQSKSKTIITRSMLTISLIVFTDNLQGHVYLPKASSYNLFNTLLIAFSRLVPTFIHVTEFTIWNTVQTCYLLFFVIIRPPELLLTWDRGNGDVPLTLDLALLCSSRPGSDLGLESGLVYELFRQQLNYYYSRTTFTNFFIDKSIHASGGIQTWVFGWRSTSI